MHILVVDPDKVDRYIVKKILSQRFQVTTLSSSVEAQAFAASHAFDIAIINMTLAYPLECIPLLHRLRMLQSNRFQSFVTCLPEDELRLAILEKAGFEGVITKPFTLEKFYEVVLKGNFKDTQNSQGTQAA